MSMNSAVRYRVWAVVGLTTAVLVSAASAQVRREIQIPDIMGYQTLKCDFHMHTVFSDGAVWPTVRVDEAWREGLDAISITDHIEYQPHKADVPTNHNRPHEIALSRAKDRGILLVRGAEITRQTPPGHFNAIFLKNINPLDTEDLLDCMEAADRQWGFIFWNHPGWKPDRKGWFDIHTTMYEKKYLRGIEVVNGSTYYPDAHKWALEKDLVMLGTSDIHAPSLLKQTTPEEHRTMTLAFAADRTIDALKDAIESGRTAIWFEDQVIGRQKYLEALLEAALQIRDIAYGEGDVRFAIRNDSDLTVELRRVGKVGPQTLNLPPHGMARVKAEMGEDDEPVSLAYQATNFLIAPQKGLPVDFVIARQMEVAVQTVAAED
jgi:hypothetical protein